MTHTDMGCRRGVGIGAYPFGKWYDAAELAAFNAAVPCPAYIIINNGFNIIIELVIH
jgi:hypothetical protein